MLLDDVTRCIGSVRLLLLV